MPICNKCGIYFKCNIGKFDTCGKDISNDRFETGCSCKECFFKKYPHVKYDDNLILSDWICWVPIEELVSIYL